MHVPDGFLDAPTSLATGAVAVAAVGLALRKAREELDERTAPLAGLTSAFIFAGQMINFPVGLGTSGHLLGGALAAVLVGPWTAMLCLSVVLVVQALLFADGGLTALGTNISLLGVTTVVVGWLATRGVLALLPRRATSVVPASAIGALLSVLAAAMVFVVLFSVGGRASIPVGALTVSMVAWHTVIGIGEAVLTAATVGAVVAVRPDLVRAVRDRRAPLLLKGPDGAVLAGQDLPRREPDRSRSPVARPVLVAGGTVTLLLAGVVSFFADPSPDGLEHVAQERGFLATARDHALADLPLADYGAVGGIPVGAAGVLGAVVTVLAGWAIFRAVGRRAHPARRADVTRRDDLATRDHVAGVHHG